MGAELSHPGLLAERGLLYDSSLMDDWEQYCFLPGISGEGLIESPRKA